MTGALRLVQSDEPTHGVDPDVETYLEWGRELRGLSPNTLRVRRDVLQRVVFMIGKPLRDFTEADLLSWERNAVSGKAPETRRAYLSHVRAFYRWAVKVKIVDADPTDCLTQPKLVRGVPRPISETDLHRAVDVARPKMRLMLLLGAFCGLRCQEIAGLQWSDLGTADTGNTLLVREARVARSGSYQYPQ